MKRYVSGALFGYFDYITYGPYYRYLYCEDFRSAVTEVKHNYGSMYQNRIYPELDCMAIIELKVKRVGKGHRWYIIFDTTERFYEFSRLEREAEDEEFRRKLMEQGTKRES